jgi:hypothetical protein
MRSVSIALCMAVLVIASVFVGAGTYAHYSGGTFTLDLSAPEPVISSLSPGETVYIVVKIPNPIGSRITAQMRLTNVLCEENGIVEPEQEWYDLYGVRNDIDTVITFSLWIDRDGNTSSCDAVDEWITEGHVDEIEGQVLELGTIEPRENLTVVTKYHMDEETENWAQSDTMTFDLEFKREEIPTGLSPGYIAGILIVASSIAAALLALRRRRGRMDYLYDS